MNKRLQNVIGNGLATYFTEKGLNVKYNFQKNMLLYKGKLYKINEETKAYFYKKVKL